MRGLIKFLVFIAFLTSLYYARDWMVRRSITSQSEEFVTKVIGLITEHWDRTQLDRHAAPNLAQQVAMLGNPHGLDFSYFSSLGARTSVLNCKLGEYTSYKNETQDYVAANYACTAGFEHGAATIFLNVIREKQDAPWRIGYFDVVSPIFSAQAQKGGH